MYVIHLYKELKTGQVNLNSLGRITKSEQSYYKKAYIM